MLGALQKLVGKKATINTYDLILLQAQAHRGLKNKFSEILDLEKLSTLDWSIMGILSENPEGCRYNMIADYLAVEPPFVTELVSKLEKQKLITIKSDITDRRAKKVTLSKKGEEKMAEIETKLLARFENIFKEITASEFETYKTVIEKLSKKEDNNQA